MTEAAGQTSPSSGERFAVLPEPIVDGMVLELRHDETARLFVAGEQHVPAIRQLHETVYESRLDEASLAADIGRGHCVVALGSTGLLGFAVQRRTGPEVLGDGELIVSPRFRRRGLGTALMGFFEGTLSSYWKISVVIDSDFYGSFEDKGNTSSFWKHCGYDLVADTGSTRVLVRTRK